MTGSFGNNFGNNWSQVSSLDHGGGFPQSKQAPQTRYRTIQIVKIPVTIQCRIIRPKVTIPIQIQAVIEKHFIKKDFSKLKKIGKILGILQDLKKLDE